MFPSKKGTVTFMKSQTIKTLGGVMSAVALISGGAGVAQAATVMAYEWMRRLRQAGREGGADRG